MSNGLRNVVRTLVPSVVGAVASYIAQLKGHLSPSTVAVIFPAVTTVYYALIRYLEQKFPKFSWLLGALPAQVVATPTNTVTNGPTA